ncbi:hypothetical protein D3C81_1294690 [compost metagenome]
MGRDHASVGKLQLDWIGAAMQGLHFQRDGDMRAELQRLHEGASGQCLPGNARGKAQVVLDARAGAGLAAGRAAVDHRDRQPLGRRIHCRRQACRPRAHYDHVIDMVRVELRQQPQA